jgi:predicted alpha/beta superfamily hydrolase
MTKNNSFNQPVPATGPVLLYGSVQFDMSSEISGRTYRIFVFKPSVPPPPSGYPLVIAADGNMTFPIMATLDATFALTGKAALVVGVGYATDDPMALFSLRTRDLTPPTPLANIQQRAGQPPLNPEDYGGSENFYRFLTEELRPVVAAAYPVDAGDQTLYGHSIAGMFTLEVLLNHPGSFRNFIISSPSIWWNKRSVLNDVPGFVCNIEAGEAAPRALILVGGTEQEVPAAFPPAITDALMKKMPYVPSALRDLIIKIVFKKKMLEYRMVDNARELAARLQQVKGKPGYGISFHAFEGEDHLTALPASIGRALAFVLRP